MHGGHEGVVARPEVPVGDGGLAALFADFALKFVEEVAGAAGQGEDDFDARGTEFGRGCRTQGEEGEEKE